MGMNIMPDLFTDHVREAVAKDLCFLVSITPAGEQVIIAGSAEYGKKSFYITSNQLRACRWQLDLDCAVVFDLARGE